MSTWLGSFIQVFTLSSLLLMPSLVSAHDVPDVLSLSLEELLSISVSGVTGVETSYLMSPASINVFDRNQLNLIGAETLSQLIPWVPGFHVARGSDGLYPSFSVRGRRIGTSSRELLVLVDGMRIDNWYAGGGSFSAPLFHLGGVKKIEFIRGANSQLYGSNAYTGVINIVTDDQLKNMTVGYGNNDEFLLQGNLAAAVGQSQHKLFFNYSDYAGQRYSHERCCQAGDRDLQDGYQSWDANYQIKYNNLSFHIQYNQFDSEHFYSAGSSYANFSEMHHKFLNSSIKYKKQWNEQISTDVQGGYRNFDVVAGIQTTNAGVLQSISSPPSEDPFRLRSFQNTDFEYWLNWRNNWEPRDWINILVGAEWRSIKKEPFIVASNYDVMAFATRDYPVRFDPSFGFKQVWISEQNEHLLGVYTQAIIDLTDSNQLTVGVRRDQFDLAGDRSTPRIAMVQRIGENSAVKAIYSESFRAPAANEYFVKNNPIYRGNLDLDAETVKTTELIWLTDLATFRAQLGYFYSEFKNPIVQVDVDGIREFANRFSNHSKGIEGNVSLQVTKKWLARLSFSHLVRKPNDQYRQPDDLGLFVLDYRYNKWNIINEIQFIGERQSNPHCSLNPVSIEPVWLINTKASYYINKKNTWTLSVENVMDEEYFSPSEGNNLNLVPESGMRIKIRYQYKFD